MVRCLRLNMSLEESDSIQDAIDNGSVKVFKTGFYRHQDTDYPLVICDACPVTDRARRGLAEPLAMQIEHCFWRPNNTLQPCLERII
ncbi:hypothetical protein [Alicyclobacillus ferrooxydans]|nr:hypothetical protein [Alicyclobacillus ferrooxydans]